MDLFFACDIENVQQALHVMVPCEVRVLFAGCGEDCSQQVDLGNVLPDDHYMQHFLVKGIERNVWTGATQQFILFTEVGGDDVAVTINLTQCQGKLNAYLSARTYNKNLFFSHIGRNFRVQT